MQTWLLPLLFFRPCYGVERLALPLEIDQSNVREGTNAHQITSQLDQNGRMLPLECDRATSLNYELSSMQRQDPRLGLSNHDQQSFKPSAPPQESQESLRKSTNSFRLGSFGSFSWLRSFGSKHFAGSQRSFSHAEEECYFCLEDLSKDPDETVIHPKTCPHSAHKACLQKWIQRGNLNCAICSKPYSKEDFPSLKEIEHGGSDLENGVYHQENRGSHLENGDYHLESGGSHLRNGVSHLENGEENWTSNRALDTPTRFPIEYISYITALTQLRETPSSSDLSRTHPAAVEPIHRDGICSYQCKVIGLVILFVGIVLLVIFGILPNKKYFFGV